MDGLIEFDPDIDLEWEIGSDTEIVFTPAEEEE